VPSASLISPLWKLEHNYVNEHDYSLMSDEACTFYEEEHSHWLKSLPHPSERAHHFAADRALDKSIHSINLRHDPATFAPERLDWRQVRDNCSVPHLLNSFALAKRRDYGGKSTFSCPWHNDDRPSFSFDHNKKVFYCFSGLEQGSVFDFVMKQNDCTFGAAVTYVNEYGQY
jgi:hypothetical protein